MRFTLIAAAVTVAGITIADTLPESMRVYPTPQEVTMTADASCKTPQSIAVRPAAGFDADALRALGETFKIADDASFGLSWSLDAALPDEGYTLTLTAENATVTAKNGTGLFYAVQTLRQLLRNPTYTPCTIKDWPAIAFRGTVEGYYGHPYTAEARKDLFRYYGTIKLNTYIYGPKNDPFHGFSNRWRDPYPADQAKVMEEMVKAAAENKVNFVWAVHPGQDIHWKDDTDIRACIAKFEMMYKLGVRSFAVFFDDIGGEGARAEKQVELLNTVNREFVRKKPDVTPLILCPTQYNRAWSGGDYLKILGTQLDSDISIMWTGNSVCTDINAEGVDWINKTIGRKAYIWWNWPVNDYCRSSLLLGPAYGNANTNGDKLSGFVANPMDKPVASKIGLFGVADYTWNPVAYTDPTRTWKDGIVRLFPNCAEAVTVFSEHNSDQGKNFHGYRREESQSVAPVLDRIREAVRNGKKPEDADLQAARKAFVSMKKAAEDLRGKCDNKAFIEEIHNWLMPFEAMAQAGIKACDAYTSGKLDDVAAALNALLKADATRRHYSEIQQKTKFPSVVNPASRHVRPMLDEVRDSLYTQACIAVTGRKPDLKAKGNVVYRFETNVPALKDLTVSRDGIYVRLPEIFEPKTLQPGEWAAIVLPPGITANWVHFILQNPNAAKQGRIEISGDRGQTWKPLEGTRISREGAELQRPLDPKADNVTAARYINTSDKPIDITFKQFKLDVPHDAVANVPETMTDGDMSSGYTFSKGESKTIPLPGIKVGKATVLPLGCGDFDVTYGTDSVTIRAKDDNVTVYEIIR